NQPRSAPSHRCVVEEKPHDRKARVFVVLVSDGDLVAIEANKLYVLLLVEIPAVHKLNRLVLLPAQNSRRVFREHVRQKLRAQQAGPPHTARLHSVQHLGLVHDHFPGRGDFERNTPVIAEHVDEAATRDAGVLDPKRSESVLRRLGQDTLHERRASARLLPGLPVRVVRHERDERTVLGEHRHEPVNRGPDRVDLKLLLLLRFSRDSVWLNQAPFALVILAKIAPVIFEDGRARRLCVLEVLDERRHYLSSSESSYQRPVLRYSATRRCNSGGMIIAGPDTPFNSTSTEPSALRRSRVMRSTCLFSTSQARTSD